MKIRDNIDRDLAMTDSYQVGTLPYPELQLDQEGLIIAEMKRRRKEDQTNFRENQGGEETILEEGQDTCLASSALRPARSDECP